MKVTCKVCNTSKNIKEAKLEPYRGKTISTKCANKECSHRIKFKVPLLKEVSKNQESIKPKPTKNNKQKTTIETHSKPSELTAETEKKFSCPNCQAEITADTKFCVECGQKIIKEPTPPKLEVIKCVKCSRIYEEGEKFCLECGTPKEIKITQPKPLPKKPIKKEDVIFKPTPQPIKKNKKGCWSVIWKVALAIIVIISIAVAAYAVLEYTEDYELADGPWEVTATLSEEFYGDNVRNRSLEEAIAMSDAEYSSTLYESSIDAPFVGNYDGTEEILLFDQYFPYKYNEFYLFTIKLEDKDNAEIKMVLHLKSEEYFEGKAFFISKSGVSIAFIKGTLNK